MAGALGVLSLGLAWWPSVGVASTIYTAGSCYTDADGYLQCEPGMVLFGFGSDGMVPGASTGARVFLTAAAAFIWWGYRRWSVALVRIGVLVAACGLVIIGPAVQSGPVAYLLAVVALVVGLRRDGWSLLGRDGEEARRRLVGRLTAASPSPVPEAGVSPTGRPSAPRR
ncbi:hypothetical protein [Nakamurella leprariae]|uniref:Uncharacterized protein n=1 Tax=Nakamurella leprariae TaxID=2803911 RepID=A0A939C089_9ACTN|nr:hypothetical protein [Nakamurella leprariae]MBM9465759.1 hypothetical protein [Nakamurella leprariae]